MDKNLFFVLLGASIAAIGTGVTELEYHNRTNIREALIVSGVGSAITGIFTYLIQQVLPKHKRLSRKQIIENLIVSTVVTFLASYLSRSLKLPLELQAILVGLAGGSAWAYQNYIK